MRTPIKIMIQAVENGATNNPVIWDEWKATLLELESIQSKKNMYEAYLHGRTDGNATNSDSFESWYEAYKLNQK
jgi:hypothetical protein